MGKGHRVSKGFERLRAVVAVSVAGGVAAVPALANVARAATAGQPVSNVAAPGFHSSVANPTAHTTLNFQGFTVLTNSLSGVGAASAAGQGFGLKAVASSSKCSLTQPNMTSITCNQVGSGVAYSGPMVSVNGQAFQAPGGIVHVSNGGLTATTGRKKMSRLKVSTRVDFLPNAVNRVVVTLTNNTGRNLRRTISVDTLLSAAIAHSSNTDDATFDSADTWAEAADGTHPSSLFARGNSSIGTLQNGLAPNTFDDTYSLKIKKHKSVRLMFFIAQDTDAAAHASTELDSITNDFENGASLESNGMLVGLSPAVRKTIKNWSGLPRR